MADSFDLERFVSAQAAVFPWVVEELQAGEKRSHWIWFIFPQMKGLGHSSQSEYYGIGSLEEATAYLRHPVLGERLRQCTRLVTQVEKRAISRILGYPDDLKFRSSMTLFARAAEEAGLDAAEFNGALKKYFGGEGDPLTAAMLR
ncbi:MAG TPA: DUF1810 domain-containing protein [Terracidiphilus sp.]|jgi:uncharacterized protein (DUF1810 family)